MLKTKEPTNQQTMTGKVIHWELSKKFKFDYTNKWYMHEKSHKKTKKNWRIVYGD